MAKLLVFFLIIPQLCLAALQVTIDPGHGGEDEGAVHGDVKESKLVLAISKELQKRLKKDPLFAVKMSRHSDHTLDLEQRVEFAKKHEPDLFLSIHANANPNRRAKGAEFYIQSQLPMDEESRLLAHQEQQIVEEKGEEPLGDVESILKDLKKSHRILKSYQVSGYLRKNWSPQKSRMIRQGDFYVLNFNETPAILVEVGYLTNPKERQKLKKPSTHRAIAKKIHDALKDYAKSMDKLPPSILHTQNATYR